MVERLFLTSLKRRQADVAPKQKSGGLTKCRPFGAKTMNKAYAKFDGDPVFLDKFKPSSASITIDSVNGGFLLLQPSLGLDRRSISWTQRGMHAAQFALLDLAWERHCEASAEPASVATSPL